MNLVEKRIGTQILPAGHGEALGIPIVVEGSPTRGKVNGREVILAGTNNYLGMTFHPECIEAVRDAAQRFGTGTTGSRMANGTYPEHRALEAELAAFYQAKSAMVFTTGFQANLGMIAALADHKSNLLLDAESHASIYDGAKLSGATTYRFKHNDAADLDKKLGRLSSKEDTLVIVEGIYSMLGDRAPLKDMCEVTSRHGVALMVDEAHSFGVLGATGRGLAEEQGVEDQVDVVVGTFSKSLGCVGGYAVSRRHSLDALRPIARSYVYSASSVPSVIASARAALRVLQREPERRMRLMENAERVYRALQQFGYELGPTVGPVVGVIIRDTDATIASWQFLLDRGVYVNLVPPSASPGLFCLLRCSLSAAHTPEQVETIIEAYRALKEQGPLA